MHVSICMCFNLETGKRTKRFVEVYDPKTELIIDSELPKRLLLPTRLPQEWLPVELRTGMSGPVRRWTDRSLFEDDDPEGLESALPDPNEREAVLRAVSAGEPF